MPLSERQHQTFKELCALVLPAWQNMPSAGDLELGDQLDRVLAVRADLLERFVATLERLRSPVDKTQLLALELEFPALMRMLTSIVCATYYLHDDVRGLLGYDGQQAQTLSRGGFGAEELVLEMMEQPKRYRDPGT